MRGSRPALTCRSHARARDDPAPVTGSFTPAHRGGSGSPLVLLHGFTDTWRTWELVLPWLEERHDVLAPTLPGHAGGEPLPDRLTDDVLVDAVERAMDDAGMASAHIAGNSLGGHVALRLAACGRARSVVALAPAGGWARGDTAYRETLAHFTSMREALRAVAPYADALVAGPEGRRRATRMITERFEHIPAELPAHLIRGVAACDGAEALIAHARHAGWPLETSRIDCPVRVIWGTKDRLLPWPAAAAGFLHVSLPHADWVELEGVGHCPQLDVPLETAQLILGFTGG
jgi:pimeloyl-ACP methyl ester carboxylesterase